MSYTVYFWIGIGGAFGSLIRGGMNRLMSFQVHAFSWSTFLVNMTGCLFIGFLWMKLDSDSQKAFWVTGVLGGLTTFSGLGLELTRYLNEKNYNLAVIYGVTSLILGIFLVWLGQKLASYF
jgi:CrcB protein